MATPAVGVWHYTDWGGGDFTYMKYWKTADKVVFLTGLAYMEGGYRGSYQKIITLPVGYRPQGTALFNVLSATGPMRLEVKQDGTVQMIGNNAPDWISLAGVFFYQYA